jgi:transketolase
MPTANAPDLTSDVKAWTRELRVDIIRMLEAAGSGHPGGSLSIIDILAVLYSKVLRHKPEQPDWEGRDRLVLSKGHACPALYAVMAHTGYFDRKELMNLRKLGSPLQGHPDRLRLPGIEASTGSLGQGLSIAQGMAMAAKQDGKDTQAWCILGDGEMQEGQLWESFMSAPKFKLGNLCAIVDYNNSQIDGTVSEVMEIGPLADKLRAFQWDVVEIDGHDFAQIEKALGQAMAAKDVPVAIIAKTVKGKGVSFMEHKTEWHGAVPNKEQADQAVEEIKNG